MKRIKKFNKFYAPSSLAIKAYVDLMFDTIFNVDIEKKRLLTRRKNIIKGI